MSDAHDDSEAYVDQGAAAPKRSRPAPGQRRLEILQALAGMLEDPSGDRVTTAA
ncbi:MAG: hypothetical protein RL357_1457, partial [Pseudomonadota bacterium]